jgi:hypothetical protein
LMNCRSDSPVGYLLRVVERVTPRSIRSYRIALMPRTKSTWVGACASVAAAAVAPGAGASAGKRVDVAIASITTRMEAVVTPVAEQRDWVSKRVFMAAACGWVGTCRRMKGSTAFVSASLL